MRDHQKYCRLVRRLRQRIFDYTDAEKAQRVLIKAIDAKIATMPAAEKRSSEQAHERAMLARSGISPVDYC